MSGRRPFVLIYDPEVKTHLPAIEAVYRGLIWTTIPENETRNRKPLYWPVVFEATNRLLIGGEEIEL